MGLYEFINSEQAKKIAEKVESTARQLENTLEETFSDENLDAFSQKTSDFLDKAKANMKDVGAKIVAYEDDLIEKHREKYIASLNEYVGKDFVSCYSITQKYNRTRVLGEKKYVGEEIYAKDSNNNTMYYTKSFGEKYRIFLESGREIGWIKKDASLLKARGELDGLFIDSKGSLRQESIGSSSFTMKSNLRELKIHDTRYGLIVTSVEGEILAAIRIVSTCYPNLEAEIFIYDEGKRDLYIAINMLLILLLAPDPYIYSGGN